MKRPPIERFHALVTKADDGCWLWIGSRNDAGYGRFGDENHKTHYAHRWSYAFHVGPIPDGYQVDHLCRVRACVNPEHLEAVPGRVNFLRSSHLVAQAIRSNFCKRNHEFTPANTYVRPKTGHRKCRRCHADKAALRAAQRRVA